MKPESMKHLQKMYAMCNEDEPVVSRSRKGGKAAARWAYRRYVQSNTAEVV